MDKNEALIQAHKAAKLSGEHGYAYAVETKFDGWIVTDRKPCMRFGKVIECCNGKEILA